MTSALRNIHWIWTNLIFHAFVFQCLGRSFNRARIIARIDAVQEFSNVFIIQFEERDSAGSYGITGHIASWSFIFRYLLRFSAIIDEKNVPSRGDHYFWQFLNIKVKLTKISINDLIITMRRLKPFSHTIYILMPDTCLEHMSIIPSGYLVHT